MLLLEREREREKGIRGGGQSWRVGYERCAVVVPNSIRHWRDRLVFGSGEVKADRHAGKQPVLVLNGR